jgi:hypothetical protein
VIINLTLDSHAWEQTVVIGQEEDLGANLGITGLAYYVPSPFIMRRGVTGSDV